MKANSYVKGALMWTYGRVICPGALEHGLSHAFRVALKPATERFGANCKVRLSPVEAMVELTADDGTDICFAMFRFSSDSIDWKNPPDLFIASWFQMYLTSAAAALASGQLQRTVFLDKDGKKVAPTFHTQYPYLSDWTCRRIVDGDLNAEWVPRSILKDWLGSAYSLFERAE